ncbi:hypothetical protein GCK32_015439 [Trichostrongylus colubriformis]|uniref:Uncharacterized protein n=1 Tax=Trichostrongylus colubriformis TaxID=6319 RepID=A0AAN8FJC1_TRICO
MYALYRRVHKVLVLEKCFGFVFDVMLASQTTVLPLAIIIYNEKLQEQFRRMIAKMYPKVRPSKRHAFNNLIDLEGKNMKMGVHEATNSYFDQLRATWS